MEGRRRSYQRGWTIPPSPLNQRVRACLAERVQTVANQPRKEKIQDQMQRVARIKHRCRQHNREISLESKRHYVTVEREHMKCMMCAQTKPFDKVTTILTQQCPAADQAHWELRIQQLKSETDKEQQGRAARDLRSLMDCKRTPRDKKTGRTKRQGE